MRYGLFGWWLVACLVCLGCTDATPTPSEQDITDAILDKEDTSCAAYIGTYKASVDEISSGNHFAGWVVVSFGDGKCTFKSNSIPNHNFGKVAFPNKVAALEHSFTITSTPKIASTSTPLSLRTDNAVFLNGVKLDLLAAACYGVGGEPLGKEKIGCFQSNTPWRYDPMFPGNDFRTDDHNAHTQPDGTYHYHGDPKALYDPSGSKASGVIGFAADGFPIYGPYIDDNGTIRKVKSGYRLKSGDRTSQTGEGAFPGGKYDGTFVDDYEWSASHGDLDECNGMTRNGSYGYYVTDTYPWVMKCFKGTPDPSFNKQPPTGQPPPTP